MSVVAENGNNRNAPAKELLILRSYKATYIDKLSSFTKCYRKDHDPELRLLLAHVELVSMSTHRDVDALVDAEVNLED
jgi:triphosphoribosyl-dephospho-CoA synthetase